jgi:hypothetical protein
MDPAIQALGHFDIEWPVPDDTAEGRLNVIGGTSEPVIEVEMAERRVEVIAPEQADDTPSKPYTLGVAGGPAQGPGRFRQLINFLRVLAFPFFAGLLLLLLLGRLLLSALREGRNGGQGQCRRTQYGRNQTRRKIHHSLLLV